MDKSYFDGKSFESFGVVVELIHDPLPSMREQMTERPGRHGSKVDSLTLEPREITLECKALESQWSDFDELMEALSAWIVTPDERKLVLRIHPGQYYMAHYNSWSEGDRIGGTGAGGFELKFVAADPIRYGEKRAYVLSGSTQKHFDVGGTDTCDMTISVKNAVRGSSKAWGMTVNGTSMRVALPDSSAHSITFDCANHVARLDGEMTGLTLDSDWPDFDPGRWRCKINEGTGTATFSWVQRYR